MENRFICQVCDKTFNRPRIKGNFVQIYKLCDNCLQHHKWCVWGRHAPLHSRFSPNNRPEGDGLQTTCNDCLPKQRGQSIKILTCANCKGDFMIQWTARYNGQQAVYLCDDCYGIVKHCKRCDTIKPRDDFSICRGKANGLNGHCRECHKAKWHNSSEASRFHIRARKFKITHTEYLQMLEEQDGICAICHQPETKARSNGKILPLSIDHCHDTGVIRKLLCNNCNHGLGHFKDSPERLRAAANYLERWKVNAPAAR